MNFNENSRKFRTAIKKTPWLLNHFNSNRFKKETNPDFVMHLKLYSKAPDFVLSDFRGNSFSFYRELESGPMVLFFYPKAFTAGCTREVCGFRDDYSFFQERGIRLVGISHDLIETQERFSLRYSLPFPLLSDPSRTVCRMYKAVYPFGLLTRRVSYFIGKDATVLGAIDNLLDESAHISGIRQQILQLENLEKAKHTTKP